MGIDSNTIDRLVIAIDSAILNSFKGKRTNHNARWGCADILRAILEHAEGERLAHGDLRSVTAPVDLETLRASLDLFNGKRRTDRVTIKYLDHMVAHGLLVRTGNAWAVNIKLILTSAIENGEKTLEGVIDGAVRAGSTYGTAVEGTSNLGVVPWLHALRAMLRKLDPEKDRDREKDVDSRFVS